MGLGLGLIGGLSLTRRRGGSVNPFTPADLFASSEKGAWYDPSDLSTLSQTSTGILGNVSVGDPVGYMGDKSGNGNHATQSTAAARPVYKTDGTLHWLAFDGVDDELVIPNDTDGAVGSDNTAVFAVRPDDGQNYPYVIGGNSDSGFEMLFRGVYETIRPAVVIVSGAVAGTGTTAFTDTSFIYSADWDRSAGRLRGWANQVEEVNETGTAADKTESSTYTLGSRGGSLYLLGRIYGGLILDRLLTDADRDRAEQYFAAKSGVTL